jgi:hypothetical protein
LAYYLILFLALTASWRRGLTFSSFILTYPFHFYFTIFSLWALSFWILSKMQWHHLISISLAKESTYFFIVFKPNTIISLILIVVLFFLTFYSVKNLPNPFLDVIEFFISFPLNFHKVPYPCTVLITLKMGLLFIFAGLINLWFLTNLYNPSLEIFFSPLIHKDIRNFKDQFVRRIAECIEDISFWTRKFW